MPGGTRPSIPPTRAGKDGAGASPGGVRAGGEGGVSSRDRGSLPAPPPRSLCGSGRAVRPLVVRELLGVVLRDSGVQISRRLSL